MISFRIVDHSTRPGVSLVEVWENGDFIATIVPSDELNIFNIISKYPLNASALRTDVIGVSLLHHIEVEIG